MTLTPAWESAAGALAALLNSGAPLVLADLYTITLQSGQVLRYTSNDRAITVNGNTWVMGPILTAGKTTLKVGISVEQLQVTLSAAESVTINGVPIMGFITRDALANARLQLDRLYADANAVPVGIMTRFTGRVADVGGGRHEKRIQIKSDTELLDVMVPRDLYQAGCKNTLWDGNCGLNRAGYTISTTVGAVQIQRRKLSALAISTTDNRYALGVLRFTSGPNAGISCTIKTEWLIYTSSTLTDHQVEVLQAFPFDFTGGDAFTLTVGCDKSQGTCLSRFANLARFRGEPYIPAPETVI